MHLTQAKTGTMPSWLFGPRELAQMALKTHGAPNCGRVFLFALTKEKIHLIIVRIEWIRHGQIILTFQRNRIPIDDVREISLLELPHCSGSAICSSILRWSPDRILAPNCGIKFTDGLCRLEGEKQALVRIDVVIFKVETLQPGILPAQSFFLHKSSEQPFFGDPIDAADQQLGLAPDGIERETPAPQNPIGFLIL